MGWILCGGGGTTRALEEEVELRLLLISAAFLKLLKFAPGTGTSLCWVLASGRRLRKDVLREGDARSVVLLTLVLLLG